MIPRELYENDDDTPEAQWAVIRWRGAAKQAFQGARGQALLRELESALLAMPSKRLIGGDWAAGGEVCSLAALDVHRMAERTGMNWDAARLVIQQTAVPSIPDNKWGDTEWDCIDPAEFAKSRLGMTYTLA